MIRNRFKVAMAMTVLAALGATSACGTSGSGDPDAAAVSLAYSPGIYINLPVHIAQEQGMFTDHGLAVEELSIPAGGQVVQAVVTGSADVGMQTTPLLQPAIADGTDLQAFCGVTNAQANLILAPTNSDLPTAAEAGGPVEVFKTFEGKSIGVPALGGVIHNWLTALSQKAGLSDFDIAAVGAGASAVTALEQGTVDLLFGYPYIAQQLIADGKAKTLIDFRKDGPASVGENPTVLFAKSTWLDANAETARSLCRSLDGAIDLIYSVEGKDVVRTGLAEHFGVTEDDVAELVMAEDGPLSLFTTDLPTCDEWKTSLEVDVAAGRTQPIDNCDTLLRDLRVE